MSILRVILNRSNEPLARYGVQILLALLLLGQAYGEVSIIGGSSIICDGEGGSQGYTEALASPGDPSISLGITSTSSLFGPGSISDQKQGSQEVTLNLGGYTLSVSYEGTVSSNASLAGQGSASSTAFVGASATGLSTGGLSHDLFGSADVITNGYISDQGLTGATADGIASYGVSKSGTPSEVWGQVDGRSSILLDSKSSGSYASTGGATNGLHSDSRATRTLADRNSTSSVSQMTTFASVIGNARAIVNTSGMAESGAWDPSSTMTKQRLVNDNSASHVEGNLRGYVEANLEGDASDISAVIHATASKDNEDLYVSGGPATYAAATQSSSAYRTYSETWIENPIWGSVARTMGDKTLAIEFGDVTKLGSGAHTYEPGAAGLSFGKALMTTDYMVRGGLASSMGNLTLNTYTEASKGKKAIAGTYMGPVGEGQLMSIDSIMKNSASYIGGKQEYLDIFFYTQLDAGGSPASGEEHNVIGRATVTSTPDGKEYGFQWQNLNSTASPNVSYGALEVSYYQEH